MSMMWIGLYAAGVLFLSLFVGVGVYLLFANGYNIMLVCATACLALLIVYLVLKIVREYEIYVESEFEPTIPHIGG